MILNESASGGDRSSRQQWKGIGGRRRGGGIELAATPSMEWKLHGGHSGCGAAAVSGRKLAASLWRLSATTDGGGSMRWQCGLFHRVRFEICSSLPIHKFEMEGVTKWDYCNSKAWDDTSYFCTNLINTGSFNARTRENELEPEQVRSTTKMKHYIKKPKDERASRMNTEHYRMCSIVKNLKDGVKIERHNCKRMDIVNSKLVRNIGEAKLSARKFMRNLGKEKKTREYLEDLCNKLAKEIEGYKAEIVSLRSQQERFQEEIEHERKMMQIAEVWKEEQAQMKLFDAKLILQNKFGEMNNLIAELKAVLSKSNSKSDSWNKSVLSNDGTCGIETVTQAEICSSKTGRSKYTSNCDKEWSKNSHNGSQKSESSGISSLSVNQSKKKESSACKPQRTFSSNKETFKRIMIEGSGRSSSGSISSIVPLASPPRRAVDEGEVKIRKNPHIVRAMKGHIEWPREISRHELATANVLEAKLESRKSLLRNVLKQRR